MPKIYLYAEILTHIRQLTLHASLKAEKHEGAKLEVTTDKTVISVKHDGETQRLYLPTQIKGDATVTFPLLKKTELAARIQIDDEHEWKCSVSDDIEVPWMASDLCSKTTIQCRHCHAEILSQGSIQIWKNLPSENWAELMDFWFCHKPQDGQEAGEEAAAAKGFSSNSKLNISSETGMSDLISLLLLGDDCKNVKAAEKQGVPEMTVLRCSVCYEMLGTTDDAENLFRLHKSQLSVQDGLDGKTFSSYHSAIFTCAQILSLIEATALKRFVVHSPVTDEGTHEGRTSSVPLILWAFNPDIYYSCSAYASNGTFDQSIKDLSADIGVVNGSEADEPQGPTMLPIRNKADKSNKYRQDDQDILSTDTRSEGSTATNSSVEHINLVHRAAKIFYKDMAGGITPADFLDDSNNASSHEELYLTNPADLVALRETLERSTTMLPESARTFQDWRIGLLNRYEKVPSGLGVMAENPLARGIAAKDGRVTRWDLGYGAEGLYS